MAVKDGVEKKSTRGASGKSAKKKTTRATAKSAKKKTTKKKTTAKKATRKKKTKAASSDSAADDADSVDPAVAEADVKEAKVVQVDVAELPKEADKAEADGESAKKTPARRTRKRKKKASKAVEASEPAQPEAMVEEESPADDEPKDEKSAPAPRQPKAQKKDEATKPDESQFGFGFDLDLDAEVDAAIEQAAEPKVAAEIDHEGQAEDKDQPEDEDRVETDSASRVDPRPTVEFGADIEVLDDSEVSAESVVSKPEGEGEKEGAEGERRSRRGRGRRRRSKRNRQEAASENRDEEGTPEQEAKDDTEVALNKRSDSEEEAERDSKYDEGIDVDDDVDDDLDDVQNADPGQYEMLINVTQGDEVRIAVLNDRRLEELFVERQSTQSLVGNIYKGKVVNVEASIQAVFVDFGLPKNGFLHISDVQPQYFPDRQTGGEDVGRKIPRHSRPPIQECFRRGSEVIVQITKDGLGTKGPTLTTYLSIPGRFLVMMPGMNKLGVSRKIEDDAVRKTMRDQLNELDLPAGMGLIVRTAGQDRSKRDLQRDLKYLMRLWKTVAGRVKTQKAPAVLYKESDLVIRTIRDVLTSSFARILVDDPETVEKVRDFLRIAMPRSKTAVTPFSETEPLFHRFGIEYEIEKLNSRHVPLPSGGSIVIDSTEAMVAIDVNSGRYRTPEDAEETAYKINLEAADEIAHQLRLRDLGGLIVCDFIDMRYDRHKRAVERQLRDALKKHKERARLLRMSAFGLIEITRQRRGPSIKTNIFSDCPHCRGTGQIKTTSSIVLDVMRIIQLACHHGEVAKITITVPTRVANHILNEKRSFLKEIEEATGKTVVINGDSNISGDEVSFICEDDNRRLVKFTTPPGGQGGGHRR